MLGPALGQRGHSRAIDEVDVEIAVAVVIEERDSRNQPLRLLLRRRCAVIDDKVDTSAVRDLLETDRAQDGVCRQRRNAQQ